MDKKKKHLHSSLGLLLFHILGQSASSGMGKGDNTYGGGAGNSTGEHLALLHLWSIATSLFLGGKD